MILYFVVHLRFSTIQLILCIFILRQVPLNTGLLSSKFDRLATSKKLGWKAVATKGCS